MIGRDTRQDWGLGNAIATLGWNGLCIANRPWRVVRAFRHQTFVSGLAGHKTHLQVDRESDAAGRGGMHAVANGTKALL